MRIAALLPTHHLPEEAMPWMAEARSVFDEVVIFIDEKRITPGTLTRAERVGTRVLRNKADTWYESDCVSMLAACESDWVFTIEYDEQLSPEWRQDGWRQILETTQFTHFWCLRRWVVPAGRYISGNPWCPDFQLRLFRSNLEGIAFPTKLHENIFVPGPGACFRNLAIHHHVLWLLSRAQREDKVRNYEQLRPGSSAGYYYLYEDYGPPEAPLPEPLKLNVNREILQMAKLPPEKILKISLEVNGVPEAVGVSELFWLDVEITNATSQTLYSCPPFFSVHLAYHWIDKATRRMFVWDGCRSGLCPGAPANTNARGTMMIIAPNKPGRYILQVTMVQERVCWFEDVHPDILQEFAVSVTA